MDGKVTVFCLGEAMGEIALTDGQPAQIAVGGDVFNTAVYLAHLGVPAAFVSALGDDPFGHQIAKALTGHGVDASLVTSGSGSTGIYTISTDAKGERSFHYWRAQSPARQMLAGRDLPALAQRLGAGVVYLSGITLWVLRDHLQDLFALLDLARAQGARIVFDGNFRPRLWGEERDIPQAAARGVQSRADLALLTFEDEQALWGDTTPQDTLARTLAQGCGLVVLKRGAEPCLFASSEGSDAVAVPLKRHPVDTTAAGDSFNAAFLACWLTTPQEVTTAILAGHQLAGLVVMHRGAILPDTALQNLTRDVAS